MGRALSGVDAAHAHAFVTVGAVAVLVTATTAEVVLRVAEGDAEIFVVAALRAGRARRTKLTGDCRLVEHVRLRLALLRVVMHVVQGAALATSGLLDGAERTARADLRWHLGQRVDADLVTRGE